MPPDAGRVLVFLNLCRRRPGESREVAAGARRTAAFDLGPMESEPESPQEASVPAMGGSRAAEPGQAHDPLGHRR
eukprot:12002332-Alexandrium_andersonii.AAC.1